MMNPIPGLDELLARARDNGIFGTKMRSVIKLPGAGLDAVVEQQFEIGRQIIGAGLVPIIEPEVDIHSPKKAEAEQQLKAALLDGVNGLADDQAVMLKLTLPDTDNLYSELVSHPKLVRVVALSGGYSRDEACERLARNTGVIASFSRALTEGLTAQQSDEEFNATLDQAIARSPGAGYLSLFRATRRRCRRRAACPSSCLVMVVAGLGWAGPAAVRRARCADRRAGRGPRVGRHDLLRADHRVLAVAERGPAANRSRRRARGTVAAVGLGCSPLALRTHPSALGRRRGRPAELVGSRRSGAIVGQTRRTLGAAGRLAVESTSDAGTGVVGRRMAGRSGCRGQYRGRGSAPGAHRLAGDGAHRPRDRRPGVVLVGTGAAAGVDGQDRTRSAGRHRGCDGASGRR